MTMMLNKYKKICNRGCLKKSDVDILNLDNIQTIVFYALSHAFYKCQNLKKISFANLTSVENNGLGYCFSDCTSLTTVPTFASLTSIGSSGLQYCFSGCTSLTTAPTFVNLTTLKTNGFRYCFQNCTSLTSISFPALTSTSFGSSTNQFNNMLKGVTGCTVHFPSNLQSVIGSWSDVTAGFGGTNTTVLFDLTATS